VANKRFKNPHLKNIAALICILVEQVTVAGTSSRVLDTFMIYSFVAYNFISGWLKKIKASCVNSSSFPSCGKEFCS
jgi:hypothetical protein